jgi:hypothetical protein
MELPKPIPIGVFNRSDNPHWDNLFLPDDGVNIIKLFSTSVNQKLDKNGVETIKKRNYLVEVHYYNGFAMIKFSPRHKKNDPNKFKIRGQEIGYSLEVSQIRKILRFCSVVMKYYLDENPDHFIGYVGQTDDRDNRPSKMRDESQRAYIYDTYVSSVFHLPKYSISSNDLFGPFNMKLVRTATKHKELTLNPKQKMNYEKFKIYLERNQSLIPEMMTVKTRRKYYPQLFE